MKISEGFIGERLIVIPLSLLNETKNNELNNDLYIHSLGFYPDAYAHYFERKNGCNEYIFIFCISGEGWYIQNENKHKIKKNDFFVLPPNIGHIYGSSLDNPWTIYWIHFKGYKASLIYNKLKQGSIVIDNNSRMEDRLSLFDKLLNALDGKLDYENITYANLSLWNLFASFMYTQSFQKTFYNYNETKNSSFINLATHYMYNNIHLNLNLKDFASFFGYSESYFYRLFKKEINESPIHYFLNLKIERSCELLSTTDLKINQISKIIGLESPLYFSNYFKKVKGVSPKKFRESIKKII